MKNKPLAPFFSLSKMLAGATLALAGTLALSADGAIRYSGSDFLCGEPEKSLNSAIEKATGTEPGSKLRGSTIGESELRSGNADFALLLVAGHVENHLPEIRDKTWRAFPLAYQVAYVVVAGANPANEISFEQLAAIFGKFSQKNASSWEDAGLPEFSSIMRPCVCDSEKTATISFFQNKALPNFSLKSTVQNMTSDAAVFGEIVNDPGIIAIVNSPVPAGVPAKTLAVSGARKKNEPATPYLPTFTNIYNADYPLAIPLYVVYPANKRDLVKPALRHLYSDEMAEKLADAGFLPLEPKLRLVYQKGIDNIK